MIAIVDYGAGNLTSVRLAFDAIGAKTIVTSSAADIAAADKVVFPGVGAAGSAMENLRRLGLSSVLRDAALSKPFMGICLGMQILFSHTEEDGGVELLGVLPGEVRRFPDIPGFKVPQMGWNQVDGKTEYYFVHSYYAGLSETTAGITNYAGVDFTSIARQGQLVAYQFHPEKSGKAGLKLLKEFASC